MKKEEIIRMEGFKKYGGEKLADLGNYVKEYLENFPNETIFIGCDSDTVKRHVYYASVIAFYDKEKKAGVHYIFKKEKTNREGINHVRTGDKRKDKEAVKKQLSSIIFNRLWGEVERLNELGEYFEKELEGKYRRFTPEELVKMGYSSHQNKLVDIHVDVNPDPGYTSRQIELMRSGLEPGMPQNRSNIVYEAAKAYLEGKGFRVVFKPKSWASNAAADMLVK